MNRLALIGNPNCGKTTLFNELTGARQRVGNWPGITVERKTGEFHHGNEIVEVVDLPGSSFTLNCTHPLTCPCGSFDDPAPYISVDALDFGVVILGEHADASFFITNCGGGVMAGQVEEDCDNFEVMEGAGAFALAGDDTLTVRVRFAPLWVDTHECALATGFGDVFLGGIGDGQPLCEVTPNILTFEQLTVGMQQDLWFQITNRGGGEIEGAVTLDDPHFILLTGSGPFTLGTQDSMEVLVRFEPQSGGSHAAEVLLGSTSCIHWANDSAGTSNTLSGAASTNTMKPLPSE